MIEFIVKRSGTTEAFDRKKAYGWIKRAASKLERIHNWDEIVEEACKRAPYTTVSSQDFQGYLIDTLLDHRTWSHYCAAGFLFAIKLQKELYGDTIPTIKELHDKLYSIGYMKKLNYTKAEYKELEEVINHRKDLDMPEYALTFTKSKYSLINRHAGKIYESPQFIYMRMAMALCEHEDNKIEKVKKFYYFYSNKIINPPTPNYVYLGTKNHKLASCCLYVVGDTKESIDVGNHIAYTQTYQGAGLGAKMMLRNEGDPIQNGLIKHLGVKSYYRLFKENVVANVKAGRDGAGTLYYDIFNKQAMWITKLRSPLSSEENRIDRIDYALCGHPYIWNKIQKNETMFHFSAYDAPDLYQALFSKNKHDFKEKYELYEKNDTFVKKYFPPRDVLRSALTEQAASGRHFTFDYYWANYHTPHLDPVYISNLCTEVTGPTHPYQYHEQLHRTEAIGETTFRFVKKNDPDGERYTKTLQSRTHLGGNELYSIGVGYEYKDAVYGDVMIDKIISQDQQPEISLCTIVGLIPANISSEEEYAEATYYAALQTDICIHIADYVFEHMAYTAKSRMNVGIGIVGLAHYFAKLGIAYGSQESKNEAHRLSERHAYHCIMAGIKLGKERGNAPWSNRTAWKDGWTPVKTYCRETDNIHSAKYAYDWDLVSKMLIENKGMRFSGLICHMPSESSSKASCTTNGIIPIRKTVISKEDAGSMIYYAAPYSDDPSYVYTSAYDIAHDDLADVYALIGKFTDQSQSINTYYTLTGKEQIESYTALRNFSYRRKLGLKTDYYTDILTREDRDKDVVEIVTTVCGSGGCEV